jgi:hypothetical protein
VRSFSPYFVIAVAVFILFMVIGLMQIWREIRKASLRDRDFEERLKKRLER